MFVGSYYSIILSNSPPNLSGMYNRVPDLLNMLVFYTKSLKHVTTSSFFNRKLLSISLFNISTLSLSLSLHGGSVGGQFFLAGGVQVLLLAGYE